MGKEWFAGQKGMICIVHVCQTWTRVLYTHDCTHQIQAAGPPVYFVALTYTRLIAPHTHAYTTHNTLSLALLPRTLRMACPPTCCNRRTPPAPHPSRPACPARGATVTRNPCPRPSSSSFAGSWCATGRRDLRHFPYKVIAPRRKVTAHAPPRSRLQLYPLSTAPCPPSPPACFWPCCLSRWRRRALLLIQSGTQAAPTMYARSSTITELLVWITNGQMTCTYLYVYD